MQPWQPLLDAFDQAVLICDPDGRIAACSAVAARLLKREAGAIIGQSIWSLLSADAPQAIGSGERAAAPGTGETPGHVLTGDGESRPVLARHAIVTLGERPARVVILNPEPLVGTSEGVEPIADAHHGALFDASRDGIGFFALDGRVLDANPAYLHMLGYTLDELRQLRYQDFTPPRWGPMEADIVRDEILARGYADDYEKEYIRRDGTIITVQVRAWLVRDDAGRPQCMAGFVRDVSAHRRAEEERQRLESELSRARRMEAVGQLAGGVAHDFNNVLTAILGNIELLRNQLDPRIPADATRLTHVNEIESAAQRAAMLTRQMLRFSRQQVRHREVLDVSAVVRDVEPLLRRIIPENIALELQLTTELTRVLADASQIEQVIFNLAVNARDAMPDGGRLTIETSLVMLDEAHVLAQPGARIGPHALLAVRDVGCGMSPEILEHIFEPFFTTKPVGVGTGLGLSTVFGVVQELGGHLRTTSEVGRGSSFEVYLPVHAPSAHLEPARSAAAQVEDTALTGAETILVCEDDDTVREVTSRFLRNAGYTVLTAGSAEDALHVAERSVGRIDLLVTDMIMPGMNGQRLSETLTAASPWLKTIFISGYPGHGVREADLLEKPFSRRSLLRRVRTALDAKSA